MHDHFQFIGPTLLSLFLSMASFNVIAASNSSDPLQFEDKILNQELVYPDWFKISFGSLKDDLEEASSKGKKGIVVYYGQKRCSYCEQFLRIDLGEPDIANYMQKHFDVIAIDIWGIEDIEDTDGTLYSEQELALHYKTNFTPSLVFYDDAGDAVFRLRGFYPPYKFRAALKYVVEGFYKAETFREYLARAEPGLFFMLGGLIERDFFSEPPYNLKEKLQNAKPLVVFFEQGKCHACELLHSDPLNKEQTLEEIQKMQSVQLDMWSNQAVITPSGKTINARDWARELGIFHAPTLLFFDDSGEEIIRIDSIVQFYRLWGVLDYINKAAYKTEPDYQLWRIKQRQLK